MKDLTSPSPATVSPAHICATRWTYASARALYELPLYEPSAPYRVCYETQSQESGFILSDANQLRLDCKAREIC
jgi:hypothetical protein